MQKVAKGPAKHTGKRAAGARRAAGPAAPAGARESESVRPPPIATAIAGHIEEMILQGVLRPGEQLASERDLAEKLDVSRPSLREALGMLERRGLLASERRGSVVTRFLTPLTRPLAELFGDKPRVTADYFEYRRLVEAGAARLAARRATDIDRRAIADILARMRAAHDHDDPTQEASADVDLHLAIYEAAHNVVFLHVLRALSELLRAGVFYNRDHLYRRHGAREALLAQHLAIGEAILRGDPDAAEKSAADHIEFAFRTVEDIRRDSERLEVSLRRLDRADLVSSRESARVADDA